jgi:hypothetical protein
MHASDPHSRIIVPDNSPLLRQLDDLARRKRLVFFAGLPGTGKSLLMHQLAHLAATHGRTVHLVQWDVARPVFEAHPAGQRYPVVEGVTHAVVRKAAGQWIRQAVLRWHAHYPGQQHLLIGETPCIGHRFIEVAQTQQDETERLLRDDACVFVIPVPSSHVRTTIETQRQRRNAQPVHRREAEDAPPHVLQALWHELAAIAPCLGISTSAAETASGYAPTVYRQVYEHVLRHRHVRVMHIADILPTQFVSVYDFSIACHHLTPTVHEVTEHLAQVEQRYPDLTVLQDEIDHWYRV